jgi:hypothetical protein
MTAAPTPGLTPAERRRLITRGLLRALTATAVLVALYYVAPVNRIDSVSLGVSLSVALLVLLGVIIWETRAITRGAYPALRAIEALATTVRSEVRVIGLCVYRGNSEAERVGVITRDGNLRLPVPFHKYPGRFPFRNEIVQPTWTGAGLLEAPRRARSLRARK